jgi:hypothetical protein
MGALAEMKVGELFGPTTTKMRDGLEAEAGVPCETWPWPQEAKENGSLSGGTLSMWGAHDPKTEGMWAWMVGGRLFTAKYAKAVPTARAAARVELVRYVSGAVNAYVQPRNLEGVKRIEVIA